MTTPMPALKPVSTDSEMKLPMKPRRSAPAASRMAPTSNASVPVAAISSATPPPGATRPSSAPVRIAMVVVVLTLSGRELPTKA